MLDLLFGSIFKKLAAGAIILVLVWGGFEIRGCMKMKEQLREYQQAEKIRQQDEKIDQETEEQKNELNENSSIDDYRRELERLRKRSKRK